MSFQHSSNLESQPTNWRREDDPQYADDPEFRDFAQQLSDKLFALNRNASQLSKDVALLGTPRDTGRVRERMHQNIDETIASFKEIGEGVKKLSTWPDVGVRKIHIPRSCLDGAKIDMLTINTALTASHAVKTKSRVQVLA